MTTPKIETLDDKADVNTRVPPNILVEMAGPTIHAHDTHNDICFCGKRSDGSEDVPGDVGLEYREGEGDNTVKNVVFRPKWRTSAMWAMTRRDVGGPACSHEGCIEAATKQMRLKSDLFRDLHVCEQHAVDEDVAVTWDHPDRRPAPPFSVKVGDIVAVPEEKHVEGGIAKHYAFGLVVAVDVPITTDLRLPRQGVQLKELFVITTTRNDADMKPAFAGDLPYGVEAMLKSLI